MLPLVARDGAFAAALGARAGAARWCIGAFGDTRARCSRRASAKAISITSRGKKLKELRRQRRRLEDSGALVHMAASGPAAAVALTDFMALEAAGWKGRAGGAARAHAATEAFMREAVTALAAKGDARIDRLIHDGHSVAASITLRSGNAAWFWKIAYDEAFARASPGVQLTLDLTHDLLADACAGADRLLRHRRPSDDRSSVEGTPDALRHADRARRGIDGAIPHRAAA